MALTILLVLLAQGVTATFPALHAVPNGIVVAAAATTNVGLEACVVAEDIVSLCVKDIPDITNAPESVVAECICCYSSTFIAPVYSTCVDYIEASAPAYSSEASLDASLYVGCTAYGPQICASAAAPSTTAPPAKSTSATAAPSTSAAVAPPACTSFADLVESCSSKLPNFTNLPNSQLASCLCYEGNSYTTAFDSYANGCANYVKTATPSDYSDFTPLTTFCQDYPPTASSPSLPPSSTPTPTATTSKSTPKITNKPPTTSTTHGTQATVTVSPSAHTTSDSRRSVGLVDWRIMGALALFLSFLFLA